ncbi:MAG: AAA family ATPase, partial [Nitrospirae bacterium]|nr:AAA family ATPase [Nitrospirota bacterium]
MNKKNIVLTGFMGTGKTEVGQILAGRLNYSLIDVDSEIEREQQMTITDIFSQFGEGAFRDIESSVIKRLSEADMAVISTGGGAVLRQENMINLRKKGIIICLAASPETIFKRTSSSNDRPLLQVENPLQKIKELLDFRMPYYEQADIIVDTEDKSPLDVAGEIIRLIPNIDMELIRLAPRISANLQRDLDRAERLRDTLKSIIEINKEIPIIVEGKKDLNALKKMGFTGEIIALHSGMGIYEFCEDIAERFHRVILLLDWDDAGERLLKTIAEHLNGLWEEFAPFREIIKA